MRASRESFERDAETVPSVWGRRNALSANNRYKYRSCLPWAWIGIHGNNIGGAMIDYEKGDAEMYMQSRPEIAVPMLLVLCHSLFFVSHTAQGPNALCSIMLAFEFLGKAICRC